MASKSEKNETTVGPEEPEILELADEAPVDIEFTDFADDDADGADGESADAHTDSSEADDANDTGDLNTDTDSSDDTGSSGDSADEKELEAALRKIKEKASEEDPRPSGPLTLRTILGGDLLTTQMVRRQIWLVMLVVAFSTIYVAFRYQCQQDMLTIDKLEEQLKHSKFRALSASSTLTEKCRESRVLEVLKQNADSTLRHADQPPYIVEVPE